MIVVCPNCNKKFKINENLIPENGRLLKCGSCNHTWHYTLPDEDQKETVEKFKNNEITINEEKNHQLNKNTSISESKEVFSNETNYKDKGFNKKANIKNNKKKSEQNILSMIIVFLISFIALIFLIDTFKLYIANFFPDIITIIDNLYATLHDLILFFKDLFN